MGVQRSIRGREGGCGRESRGDKRMRVEGRGEGKKLIQAKHGNRTRMGVLVLEEIVSQPLEMCGSERGV